MKVKDLEKLAEKILAEVDSIARDVDHYEYGLPSNESDQAKLKLAVMKLIDEAKE